MLSVASTWFRRGSGQQFRIPTRWGSQGRLNLIGTYTLHGTTPSLELRTLQGSCNQEQVIAYLDTLAHHSAAFHRAKPLGNNKSVGKPRACISGIFRPMHRS